MSTTSNRVVSGFFTGFTKAEITAIWQAFKADPFARQLTSASINGQSLSWPPGISPQEKQRMIQQAMSQVDPSWCPPSQQIAVRFSAPSY